MTERASCSGLIDFVAGLINDPTNELFSRNDVQAALDAYRIEARYEELTPIPTKTGSGVSYLIFQADTGDWETDGILYDGAYTAITPATADWTAGRWTFATAPARPVYLLGWTHDPYNAAADLLVRRAGQVAENYDFKTGPDSYMRSQARGGLLALAAQYRGLSKGGGLAVHEVMRSDVLYC